MAAPILDSLRGLSYPTLCALNDTLGILAEHFVEANGMTPLDARRLAHKALKIDARQMRHHFERFAQQQRDDAADMARFKRRCAEVTAAYMARAA